MHPCGGIAEPVSEAVLRLVLDKGFDFADHDAKTPITPNTRFYIALMAKQFTAAAMILLRKDRGKLGIDDPSGKHVSGLPDA